MWSRLSLKRRDKTRSQSVNLGLQSRGDDGCPASHLAPTDAPSPVAEDHYERIYGQIQAELDHSAIEHNFPRSSIRPIAHFSELVYQYGETLVAPLGQSGSSTRPKANNAAPSSLAGLTSYSGRSTDPVNTQLEDRFEHSSGDASNTGSNDTEIHMSPSEELGIGDCSDPAPGDDDEEEEEEQPINPSCSSSEVTPNADEFNRTLLESKDMMVSEEIARPRNHRSFITGPSRDKGKRRAVPRIDTASDMPDERATPSLINDFPLPPGQSSFRTARAREPAAFSFGDLAEELEKTYLSQEPHRLEFDDFASATNPTPRRNPATTAAPSRNARRAFSVPALTTSQRDTPRPASVRRGRASLLRALSQRLGHALPAALLPPSQTATRRPSLDDGDDDTGRSSWAEQWGELRARQRRERAALRERHGREEAVLRARQRMGLAGL